MPGSGLSYESLKRFASSVGVEVTRDAIDRIDRYFGILALWNPRLRLTGEPDLQVVVDKHAVDAVAVAPLLREAGTVIDIGTGAGFPGMILACVRPDLAITLVDSRERPISFLREVIRQLAMTNVRAEQIRAEEAGTWIPRQEVAVSCAVRMAEFFRLARPLLDDGGMAISMQTPHLDRDVAERAASAAALRLVRFVAYRLPNGVDRELVVATVA